jgi:hypothetical protein
MPSLRREGHDDPRVLALLLVQDAANKQAVVPAVLL